MVGRLNHLPRAVVRPPRRRAARASGLADAADRPLKTFSGGMRRRLDLAASLSPRRRSSSSTSRRPASTPAAASSCGTCRGPRPRGYDRAADHPVPGGGRPPGRRHRRPRRRPVVAQGSPGRAEGAHRRRAPRSPSAGPTTRAAAAALATSPATARLDDGPRASWRPPHGVALADVVGAWTPSASPSSTCTAARRCSTTSSSPSPTPRRRPGGRRLTSAYAERCAPGCPTASSSRGEPLPRPPDPEKLIDVTIQPLMFVLLFAYVFGGAIAVPGRQLPRVPDGRDLHPDADLRRHGPGHVDGHRPRRRRRWIASARSRWRARLSWLGHVLAEFAATLLGPDRDDARRPHRRLAHPHRRPARPRRLRPAAARRLRDAVAGHAARQRRALARCRRGWGSSSSSRSPSSPTRSCRPGRCPTVLQHVSDWNPVSALAAAVRTLFGNPTATPADAAWPLQHPVAAALLWCVGLLAVVVPLALAAYRRRTEAPRCARRPPWWRGIAPRRW